MNYGSTDILNDYHTCLDHKVLSVTLFFGKLIFLKPRETNVSVGMAEVPEFNSKENFISQKESELKQRMTNGVEFCRPGPISHILVCGSFEQGAVTWNRCFHLGRK